MINVEADIRFRGNIISIDDNLPLERDQQKEVCFKCLLVLLDERYPGFEFLEGGTVSFKITGRLH